MDSRYQIETDKDNAVLRKLLTPLLRDTAATPSGVRPRSGPVQILNLACGACREFETISSALADSSSRRDCGIRFVGADIRRAQISEARDRARLLSKPGVTSEFIHADCSKLGEHRQIGTNFDMVFLRHQNYWDDPAVWRRMFESSLERLHDSGLLVITSYFDREHDLAVKAITGTGGQLVTSVRNGDSRELGSAGKSVDRHIAVFRRAP